MSTPFKNGRRRLPCPWRPRIVTVMYVLVQYTPCDSTSGADFDFRPALLFLTVVVVLLVVMREATSAGPQLPITAPSFLKYQTLTGYFLQDDPKIDPLTFDYVGKPVATAFLDVPCTRISLTESASDNHQLWPYRK